MLIILGIGGFGTTKMFLARVLSAYQFKHSQHILSTYLRR